MESTMNSSQPSGCSVTIFSLLLLLLIGTGSSDSSSSNSKNDTSTKSLVDLSDKPFRCYTCSWSEMANITTPNVDFCSSYKFVPEAAALVACDLGCQTVSYRTTRKEDARHFHRNCLKKQSSDIELKDKCHTTKSKSYGFEEICECLTNLCNGVSAFQNLNIAMTSFGILSAVAHLAFWWWTTL